MREYGRVSPQFWIDHNGKEWKVPQIKGRLKFRIPSHRALRDYVMYRDKHCLCCGSLENLVADHIVSRRNGGLHHPDNLQVLCDSCNARKANLVDARAINQWVDTEK
jgi:5-methylcytosine-specific restriction endonuclease McrA